MALSLVSMLVITQVGVFPVQAAPEGLQWVAQSSGVSVALYGIAYNGDGGYVVVGNAKTILRTADDGANWTVVTLPDSIPYTTFYDVCYANGQFTAVGSSNVIITSTDDGATWARQTSPLGDTTDFGAIAYGNGVYVALGGYPQHQIIRSTDDGITWNMVDNPIPTGYKRGIIYGNARFIVFGYTSPGGNGFTLGSPDGLVWILQMNVGSFLNYPSYGNGNAVVVSGNSTKKLLVSPIIGLAPQVWAEVTVPLVFDPYELEFYASCYGNGIYVLVGERGYCAISFDNAETWELSDFIPSTSSFNAIVYGNNEFITVGTNGAIFAASSTPAPIPPPFSAGGGAGALIVFLLPAIFYRGKDPMIKTLVGVLALFGILGVVVFSLAVIGPIMAWAISESAGYLGLAIVLTTSFTLLTLLSLGLGLVHLWQGLQGLSNRSTDGRI